MKKITLTNRRTNFVKVEDFLENLYDEGKVKEDVYASIIYLLDEFFRILSFNSGSNSVNIAFLPLDAGLSIELDLNEKVTFSNERINELLDFFNQMEKHNLIDRLEIDWKTVKFSVFFKDDSIPTQLAKTRVSVLMRYFEPKLERAVL